MRLLAWMVVAWLAGGATATAQPDDDYAGLEACAPSTLEAALACLETNLPNADREKLLATPFNDLVLDYHFGLGSWIRNEWRLWEGNSLHDDMRKRGFGQADAMSMDIIQLFWLDQHGCSRARQQQAAYRKALSEEADLSAASSPDGMPVYEDIKVQAPHLDCTTPAEATAQ